MDDDCHETAPPELLQIKVIRLDGSQLDLELPCNNTFQDLADLITNQLGIERTEQKIVVGTSMPSTSSELKPFSSRGVLVVTLVCITEPEVLETLQRLYSCSNRQAAAACLDAANRFWSGDADIIVERRRNSAIRLGYHKAILQALRNWSDDDVLHRGCQSLAHIVKATKEDEFEISAEQRRQAIADAGALEVLVTQVLVVASPFAKEHACNVIARLCKQRNDSDAEAVAAAEHRRQCAVDAGALQAIVAVLRIPTARHTHVAAVHALNNLVGQDEKRRKIALDEGADDKWLTCFSATSMLAGTLEFT